ncbi:hypothetical protein HEP87_56025 [Streptomyces sp. S1D4-11]
MPSRDERRCHYDAFVAHVRGLCRTPRIRSRLENGRGQPLTECPRMDAYLVKPCQGFGARRAHYTIASLIALERPVPDWTETTPPRQRTVASTWTTPWNPNQRCWTAGRGAPTSVGPWPTPPAHTPTPPQAGSAKWK